MNIFSNFKSRKSLILLLLLFAILTSSLGVYASFFAKKDVVTIDAIYAFNVHDYRELAVFYKYIFVGRVDEITGTDHYEDYYPTTNYNVTPIMNIKGNLKLNESIPYKKRGGLSKDKKYLYCFSEDILPEVGELYIFCSRARDGGEILYSSGANTTIKLEDNISEKNIEESDIVNRMIFACENPKYVNDYIFTESNTRSIYDQNNRPTFSIDDLVQDISLLKTNDTLESDLIDKLDEQKLSELAGNYNYFFVGKFKDEGKVISIEEGTPYFEYTVIPVYSIIDGTKENYPDQQFVSDVEIPFIKYGGLEVYDDGVEVATSQIIPEPGKLYMFTCVSTADGTKLYSYSPYAIIPLEEGITEDNIEDSELVAKYISARKNPVEIKNPISLESGKQAQTRYTLENYRDYIFDEEISKAHEESREPDFDYISEFDYEYPECLED